MACALKSRQLQETGYLVMQAYTIKRVTDAIVMKRLRKNVIDLHVK